MNGLPERTGIPRDAMLADDTPDPRPGRTAIVLHPGVAAQVLLELEVDRRSYGSVAKRCGRTKQWLHAAHAHAITDVDAHTIAHAITDVPPELIMLELINKARAEAGVPPVRLGTNRAAQLHAEAMHDNCFSAHWGLDGLSADMRYNLAGGQQSSAENVSGRNGCFELPVPRDLRESLLSAMSGFMRSPGHRATILDHHIRFGSIGMAGTSLTGWSLV